MYNVTVKHSYRFIEGKKPITVEIPLEATDKKGLAEGMFNVLGAIDNFKRFFKSYELVNLKVIMEPVVQQEEEDDKSESEE